MRSKSEQPTKGAPRIAVVDDIRQLRDNLVRQVKRLRPDATVKGYADLADIDDLASVSVLLVDVELAEGRNGMDEVRGLIDSGALTQVIYVTGHPEYISASFATRPVGYLLKPVKRDALDDALSRAFDRIERNRIEPFTVTVKSAQRVVRPAQVMYVESSLRVCTFFNADGTSMGTYNRLITLQARLPSWFIRTHKSYLINPAYVDAFTGDAFIMADGRAIPVSKNRRADVDERFRRFVDDHPVTDEVFGNPHVVPRAPEEGEETAEASGGDAAGAGDDGEAAPAQE